ncbi:SCAN domain-containing protein 3-like, partial [Pogonomyrmex barbatus]|uniref:SCAN domain-containing protein 3-like n=1 Tax=Pogonomyrmex barbatus TaxID=144034 RepID=A0A6I9W163_9HYME
MDNQRKTLSSSSDSSSWKEKWFIMKHDNQTQCLIYGTITNSKKYNVGRHYNTKHGATYDKIEGPKQIQLLHDLKSAVSNNKEEESELSKPALYASYKIAHLIARESHPFSIGPFLKQCLEIAAETIYPNDINKFKSISLSSRTVVRRIEKLAEDLERQLVLKANNFIAFSLALDESTDIVDTAQL